MNNAKIKFQGTVRITVPVSYDGYAQENELVRRGQEICQETLQGNGAVQVEVENLTLAQVTYVRRVPAPLEVIRLILQEYFVPQRIWQQDSQDCPNLTLSIVSAITRVLSRLGFVVMLNEDYVDACQEKGAKVESIVDLDPPRTPESIVTSILLEYIDSAPSFGGYDIVDAIAYVMAGLGYTVVSAEWYWDNVEQEPMTATADSRDAAGLPR